MAPPLAEDADLRWASQPSASANGDLSCSGGEFAPPEIKAEISRSLSLRIPRSDGSPITETPPQLQLSPKTPSSNRDLRRSISLKRIIKWSESEEPPSLSLSPSKLSPQARTPVRSSSFTSTPPKYSAKPPSPIGSPGGVTVPTPAASFYGSPAVKLSPLGKKEGVTSPLKGTARTLFERRTKKDQDANYAQGNHRIGETSTAGFRQEGREQVWLGQHAAGASPETPKMGGKQRPQLQVSSPREEGRLRELVTATDEDVFRNLVQSPPEQASTSGRTASDASEKTSGFYTEPVTPTSKGNTPALEKHSSTKPGHERKLSLSNSAPLMVTPPEALQVRIPEGDEGKMVVRSNSSLEARALYRMRQDQFIQQLLNSNTIIGRDYTIKVDVSSAQLGFGSFDLSDGGDYDDRSSIENDTPSRLALTDYSESGHVIPPLTIAILIVGTRGDVQPFIAIGKRLIAYGHRVRLATHANYRQFVTEQGLEFFPLGGDPKILAEYMVKNKGFLPSWPSEVKEQRKQLKSIIFSTWDACTSPDWESNGKNFIADAIIANPPVYGHIHVAERLKIPLHMIFTMPWSPTGAFPHPLARLTQYAGFENRLSYTIVDSITWLGVRDIINSFRKKKLKLAPISLTERWSGSMLQTNKVPFAYIWSPSLVPKPKDWGSHIDVVGFCILDLATDYKPPADLDAFLREGPPPVFIGFGSLPVGDPQKMTAIIFEALRKTGMRGIIQKGWGGLGEGIPPPPSVHILGNCPHDWLFPQCSAVVHHGGAGTTAAGLLAECPTTVVPFFGDQPFWGAAVFTQGVGPKPIPVGDFNLDRLVKALEFMARPEVKEAAVVLAEKMRQENGVEGAVRAFHKHLPRDLKNAGRKMLWGLARKRAKAQPTCGCFG